MERDAIIEARRRAGAMAEVVSHARVDPATFPALTSSGQPDRQEPGTSISRSNKQATMSPAALAESLLRHPSPGLVEADLRSGVVRALHMPFEIEIPGDGNAEAVTSLPGKE